MFEQLKNYFQSRTVINAKNLEEICKYFQVIKTKRNEFLLNEGDICKHYYFVNKGCLRIFSINNEGTENTRYFAFEGFFGTALPSLIEQMPAFEYVQTIEPSELLCISHKDFFNLVDTIPQFAFIYRQILEVSFISAQKRIYGFQGSSALEKVKSVKKYNSKILSRLSNKMAASFLGITPSTLSRIKSQL
jgi:CRP-like cAMP-binding protein